MTPSLRLKLIATMIVISTLYGVLVAQNPQVASAIAVGYVALLLTVFALVQIWKKP